MRVAYNSPQTRGDGLAVLSIYGSELNRYVRNNEVTLSIERVSDLMWLSGESGAGDAWRLSLDEQAEIKAQILNLTADAMTLALGSHISAYLAPDTEYRLTLVGSEDEAGNWPNAIFIPDSGGSEWAQQSQDAGQGLFADTNSLEHPYESADTEDPTRYAWEQIPEPQDQTGLAESAEEQEQWGSQGQTAQSFSENDDRSQSISPEPTYTPLNDWMEDSRNSEPISINLQRDDPRIPRRPPWWRRHLRLILLAFILIIMGGVAYLFITSTPPPPPLTPRQQVSSLLATQPPVEEAIKLADSFLQLENAEDEIFILLDYAARKNSTEAMRRVAEYYDPLLEQKGTIIKDAVRAYKLYIYPAGSGDPLARERRTALEEWARDNRSISESADQLLLIMQ